MPLRAFFVFMQSEQNEQLNINQLTDYISVILEILELTNE